VLSDKIDRTLPGPRPPFRFFFKRLQLHNDRIDRMINLFFFPAGSSCAKPLFNLSAENNRERTTNNPANKA
jgi:hypothetical protein